MMIANNFRSLIGFLAIRMRSVSSESGATAVEYGILIALIAAVLVTVIMTLGTELKDAFQTVIDNIPG